MRLTSTLVFIGIYGQAVLAGPCRASSSTTSLSTTETSSQSGTPTETPTSQTTGTTSHSTTEESSTPSASLSTTPGSQSTTPTSQSTTPSTTPSSTTTASTTCTDFCILNSAVIESLRATPAATSFCDEYLSFTTSKSTRTITVTPTPINSLEPITVTVTPVTTFKTLTPRESLDLETKTETIFQTYVTTATVPSVDVLSCLTAAYYANAAPTVVKRTAEINPPYIPADWVPAQISQACSCLSLDSPATTVTQYDTLTPSVVVETSTHFYTPIVVITETPVVTVTSIITDPVTIASTSEATSYAVETQLSTPGLSYRQYTHTFSADLPNNGFSADAFKSLSPVHSGILASPDFSSPNWPNGAYSLTLSDGHSVESTYSALLFSGFFYAKQTGLYVFASHGDAIDNWGYLWLGNDAYSWSDSNTAIMASRTYAGNYGGSYSVLMNAGDAIPMVWLWANGGGQAQSDLTITAPDSSVIGVGGSGNFLPACNDDVFFGFS